MGPAPLAPGEPGEGFVADDGLIPLPPPGDAEDFTPLPPGESGEVGAPPLPEAGLAADIPATDLPPLPEGSEGEIYIATGASRTGLPPLVGGSEGEITIAPGTAPLPPLPAGSDGGVYVAPDTLPATGLPPLPGASEGGIAITPGTSPTPGLAPVPPTALKLEITALTLDFSKDVAAFAPPIGSPIGGSPVRARSEPTEGITELTKAVDDTTRAPGVRTEDGAFVTAPTSGYVHSDDYIFTGTTEADRPTYFAPITDPIPSIDPVTLLSTDTAQLKRS